MKSKDKLVKINELVERINTNILKGKEWHFTFENKGANNYCICIIKDKQEFYTSSFGTFDNVIASLELILTMFNIELNKKKEDK